MFGFFAAEAEAAETTKTAVDKMKRKRMAERLPVNPRRENGKRWMDQNLGRVALNLLLQAGEFLFESLAAGPFPQRADHQKHQLHHEALRRHNGD